MDSGVNLLKLYAKLCVRHSPPWTTSLESSAFQNSPLLKGSMVQQKLRVTGVDDL